MSNEQKQEQELLKQEGEIKEQRSGVQATSETTSETKDGITEESARGEKEEVTEGEKPSFEAPLEAKPLEEELINSSEENDLKQAETLSVMNEINGILNDESLNDEEKMSKAYEVMAKDLDVADSNALRSQIRSSMQEYTLEAEVEAMQKHYSQAKFEDAINGN